MILYLLILFSPLSTIILLSRHVINVKLCELHGERTSAGNEKPSREKEKPTKIEEEACIHLDCSVSFHADRRKHYSMELLVLCASQSAIHYGMDLRIVTMETKATGVVGEGIGGSHLPSDRYAAQASPDETEQILVLRFNGGFQNAAVKDISEMLDFDVIKSRPQGRCCRH
ncbi:hypothetical protein Nepgr_017205 [Nepenthes gracilis]|uniref:Uncharacterized protein n=1 Tax=Nepenthes gracilis TaxID=150966 RepID=A0AAD3SR31_NEPGR|nr:hypothetical protein Nepgr_017205 [Nepenthes gracilis]